ncbi:MAG: ATP-binding cassette domain-containing protein [Planctomycetia bacterium]|nr:ATP-binding cassette domain-containing protein [Planctomycetia bacterium]
MIAVHGLTKRFVTGSSEVLAVDHVSFQVHMGEVYGLLGENGAGKTTTLRMILGLVEPTEGYAEIGGVRSVDAPEAFKRQIGLVSTSGGLYQWLTPREVLLFFADLYDVPPDRAKAEVDRLAGIFDLRSFLDRRCATLSTGQKQRVVLARALIHDPMILLLDEPTRGLDVFGSKVIFDYVLGLRGQGKAVIVTTHRLHEAERLCDRFGLLHRGKLVREGTLHELKEQSGCESLVEMFLSSVGPAEA